MTFSSSLGGLATWRFPSRSGAPANLFHRLLMAPPDPDRGVVPEWSVQYRSPQNIGKITFLPGDSQFAHQRVPEAPGDPERPRQITLNHGESRQITSRHGEKIRKPSRGDLPSGIPARPTDFALPVGSGNFSVTAPAGLASANTNNHPPHTMPYTGIVLALVFTHLAVFLILLGHWVAGAGAFPKAAKAFADVYDQRPLRATLRRDFSPLARSS